jgi:hypothetical protein
MRKLITTALMLSVVTAAGPASATEAPTITFKEHSKSTDGGGGGSATDPHDCNSKIQMRGDGWGETSPDVVTPYGVGHKVTNQHIYTTLIGKYCPNGKDPAKFFPTKASHCYQWLNDKDEDPPYFWFEGTEVNPRFYEADGGRNGNPPAYKIKDDKTRQNCGTQKFSSGKSAWLRCDNDPRWRAWVKIILKNPLADVEFAMKGKDDRPYNKLICSDMSKFGGWVKP